MYRHTHFFPDLFEDVSSSIMFLCTCMHFLTTGYSLAFLLLAGSFGFLALIGAHWELEGEERKSHGAEGFNHTWSWAFLSPQLDPAGTETHTTKGVGWGELSQKSLPIVSGWQCEPSHSSKAKYDLGKVASMKWASLRPWSMFTAHVVPESRRKSHIAALMEKGFSYIFALAASGNSYSPHSWPEQSVTGILGSLLLLTRLLEQLRFRGSQKSCRQPPTLGSPPFWWFLVDGWTGRSIYLFLIIKLVPAY